MDTKEAMEIIKRGFGFENDDSSKNENDAIPLFIIHGYHVEPSISLKFPLENFKGEALFFFYQAIKNPLQLELRSFSFCQHSPDEILSNTCHVGNRRRIS